MQTEKEHYSELVEELKRFPGARILAVSKTFPEQSIQNLYDAGVRDFGESRILELERKYQALPKDIRWHFIGNIQANKVRRIVKIASCIQSVSSGALLERIDRIAAEENCRPEVFLELNISGEESKSGMTVSEFEGLIQRRNEFKNVFINGLMTMAPQGASEEELREIFGSLRHLADAHNLKECSMGMSEDYRIALEMGSSIIRIGSKIFGKR